VELQGSNLFVVGFMYDDAGRPVWYYTAGPLTDAVAYRGGGRRAVPPGDFNYEMQGECVDSSLREFPYNVPLAATLPFITRQGPIVKDVINSSAITPVINAGGLVETVSTIVSLRGVRP
jgi:hypothetical protein